MIINFHQFSIKNSKYSLLSASWMWGIAVLSVLYHSKWSVFGFLDSWLYKTSNVKKLMKSCTVHKKKVDYCRIFFSCSPSSTSIYPMECRSSTFPEGWSLQVLRYKIHIHTYKYIFYNASLTLGWWTATKCAICLLTKTHIIYGVPYRILEQYTERSERVRHFKMLAAEESQPICILLKPTRLPVWAQL